MNRRQHKSRRMLSIHQRKIAMLAGAVGVMIVQHQVHGATYFWDQNAAKVAPGGGGTGVWDTSNAKWYPATGGGSDVIWPNSADDFAQFSGTAGVVTVSSPINVNRLTFTVTNYSVTFTGGNAITFGGTAPEIDLNAGSCVISAPILGMGTSTTPLKVNMSGANTLAITGSNSFSGAEFQVNNGKLSIQTTANQITGAGNLLKTGAGSMTLTNGNNNTGNWSINAGVLEAQSASSLGASAVIVTVSGDGSTTKANSGELVISNLTDNHAITLAGGILSGDSSTAPFASNANFANSINVTANSNIRLGNFFDNKAQNLTIGGTLSGSGNLALLNASGGSNASQSLILSGNNSGYTGQLTIDGGHNVRFNNSSAFLTGGVLNVASSGSALAGVVLGDPSISAPAVSDSTNSGGVLGLGNGINYTTPLDLSNLGTGYTNTWMLGADLSGGTYSAASLGVAPGNVYRLGGGGGTLAITSSVLVDNGSPASVTVGDSRSNGGGTVILLADQTYTGGTTINGGTLQVGNGGASGSLVGNTTVGGGANLAFNHSTALAFSGNATITTGGLVVQNGAGPITFGGSINNSGTLLINNATTANVAGTVSGGGTINVSGGTLGINAGGSLDGSPNLVLNGGNVSINNANTDSAVAGTTINNGSSMITGAFAGGGNTLNLNGITRNTGGVVDFALSTGNVRTSTANANFSGGQQTILGGYATFNGNTWAVSGSGSTPGVVTGLTTYNTNFDAGTDVDMTPDGGTQPNATGTVNSIRFNSAGTYTINTGGNITVATGGILETANVGANTVAINGNQLTTANGQDLIVIQNNTAAPMTISSTIPATGTTGLTKAGPGALTLSAANAFTGGLRINGGTVNYSADNNLGGTGSVILNGGAVDFTATSSPTNTRVFSFGASGGTFTIDKNPTVDGGGKFTFSTANLITGSGTINKNGGGWFSFNSANNATGNWVVNGGVVEVGGGANNNPLGTTTSTVYVNGSGTLTPYTNGELAANNKTVSNPIVLNGGILSSDNGTGNFSGTVNVLSNSTLRIGDFYGQGIRGLNVSGNISGSGGLNLYGPLGPTPAQGQILTLSGNNSGYTGTVNMGAAGTGTLSAFYTVRFQAANPTAAANAVIKNFNFNAGPQSPTAGLPVVVFDSTDSNNSFGSVSGVHDSVLPPTITDQSGNSGVFAYNGANYMGGVMFDLAPLNDGKVFFGTVTGGTFWGYFKPGSDHTVRLADPGTGTLGLGQVGAIADITDGSISTPTNAVIGAVASNGGGIVKFSASQTYTGGTAIQNGTLLLAGSGAVSKSTVVTFGTGSTNGALDLNGLNTPVGGLTVDSNVPSGNVSSQIVTNNSTASNSVLTVDTTGTSSTFAGVIKDGASKNVGLTVTGTHTLMLTGNNTYTGTTSVKDGKLILASDNSRNPIFNSGGADITGGQLVFDYSNASDPTSQVISTLQNGFTSQSPKFSSGPLRTSAPTDPDKGLGFISDTTAKQISVFYTYYGDANGDLTVNALDFNALATNFGGGGKGWSEGDFDYNGTVNSVDFDMLAMNFNKTLALPGSGLTGALGTLVPEPGTIALLAIGAMGFLGRRRRYS